MVWKNPWYDPSLKHHTPNGFRNTLPVGHQPGDLDRWRKARKEAGLPKPPALGYDDFIRQWSSPIIITIILMTQPFAGSSSAFPTSVVSFRWAWPTGFVAGEQNAWSNSTGGRVSPGRG